MAPLEVLVVGPADHQTGGIAQYISQQHSYLPDDVQISVYDNGSPPGSGPGWFVYSLVVALFDALKFPFQTPPDVVHIHTSHGFSFYRTTAYVFVAKYLWQRPVVLHVHGSSFDEFVQTDNRVVKLTQNVVFGASDRVVVLSEYWREVLEQRIEPTKLLVLPNAVDTDQYTPRSQRDPPHLVFISNQIERKGIREFVDAVESLRERGYDEFKVTIAGDGPLSDLSEKLAAEDDRTEYLGYVSEDRKRELLERGSIYVLPTYAEGLPIALLEGLAGANAIVSTDVGSIPEIIDPDNGRIVQPGDVDGLTSALADLIASPEEVREMGGTNYEMVANEYDWTAIGQQLCDEYRAVADKQRQHEQSTA